MREILFRGKQSDNNKWVYGSYFAHQKVNLCIITEQDEVEKNTQHLIVQDKIACDWNFKNGIQVVDVNPKTLGQYTGLTDKNGTKIFEGDILSIPAYLCDGEKCVCVYQGTDTGIGFELIKSKRYWLGDDIRILSDEWEDFEVIGNIHDNPELIQGDNNYE